MVIIQEGRYAIFSSDKMSNEEKILGTSHECVAYILNYNERNL